MRTALAAAAVLLAAGSCESRAAGVSYRTVGTSLANARLVVVLLHGYGAPGDDLVRMASDLSSVGVPEGTCFVLPVGLKGSGGVRYWYARDEDAAPARATIDAFVTELRARARLPPSRVVLGGFSQGATLAVDVALRADTPPGLLLALSGRVPWGGDWPNDRPPMRALVAHGRRDGNVPFSSGEAVRDLLKARGHQVEWVEHAQGHTIPREVLEAAARALREQAAAP